MGDNMSTVNPCSGPDVDEVVRLQHHVLVVFDDDYGITSIPQGLKALDEAFVVPLVQPDARFIEDVEHFGEPATDLRRQPNALRFPSRQGTGRAIQGEVVQPYVHQKAQPSVDLLQWLAQNRALLIRQSLVQPLEPIGQSRHVHVSEFCDVLSAEFELEADGLQACSFA